MSHRHRSFLVVTLVCACLAPVAAQRFAGRVLEVTDGDTVIVARGNSSEPLGFSPAVVRLFGIDAPEGTQPYGAESTAALSRLVMGKVIDVDMKDVDQYGRLVATVSVGGADVNEALVRAGAAWHYPQYSDSAALAAAERDARASRRGLWQSASPQARGCSATAPGNAPRPARFTATASPRCYTPPAASTTTARTARCRSRLSRRLRRLDSVYTQSA